MLATDLQDPTAEKHLLGAVLYNPEAWTQVRHRLLPAWFSEPFHASVIQAALAEAEGGAPPSPSRVGRRLATDGKPAPYERLREFQALSYAEADGLCDLLEDLWRRRELLAAMRESAASLADTDLPLQEAQARLAQTMRLAMGAVSTSGVRDWSEVVTDVHARVEEYRRNEAEPSWPVGLSRATAVLGGLARRRLYVIMARPNAGKSALIQHIVRWLALRRGVPSLVFTPDQLASEWVERAVWDVARIPGSPVADDDPSDDLSWRDPARWPKGVYDRVQTAFSEIAELPIRITDRRGYGVDRLCAIARAEKAANPEIGIVVLDHLTRLRFATEDRRRNWSGIVGDAVSQLRDLAEELDVALLLACQLNREVERRPDKRPMLSDARESGEIEEHADVVLGLYRHEYYHPPQSPSAAHAGVVELHALKQKQGGRNEMALVRFEPSFCRFSDLPPDKALRYHQEVYSKRDGGKVVPLRQERTS